MAAEHFSLKIQDRGAGTPPALAAAALAAAKRISSRVQGAKTLELDVGSCLAQVPPESIACASLTRLVVGAAATLDMILRLIRALPNLDSLVLYELASNETPASMSAPAPGTGYAVEPLGTRLKVLSINARQGDPSWKMAVPVAKCLLLRIPTLDTFSAIYAPAKPIMYFVRECSKWYPHLARIRFFLDSSNGSSENQRAGGAVTDP
ncbi:hypothetical protein H4R18_003823 [Coemansia javaensis]|uniref:Uncharacterized protein n=1 Tax=Coemansia javaensis TaxID=2761396 RepID=A0A9W8HCJ6_9FUNG|nr:hypothetical protein H4R18_003823 [Coemansia javaensis]